MFNFSVNGKFGFLLLFLFFIAFPSWIYATHITYDGFADSVKESSTLVFDSTKALGSPDNQRALISGVDSFLILDMGEGEEGTDDLKIEVLPISVQAVMRITLLDSTFNVIKTENILLEPSEVGFQRFVFFKFSDFNRAYRYVRIQSLVSVGVGIDAIVATSHIGKDSIDTDGDGCPDRVEQHSGTNPQIKDCPVSTATPVPPPIIIIPPIPTSTPDISSLSISKVDVTDITTNSVIVNWKTSKLSTEKVRYGLTNKVSSETNENTEAKTQHTVNLSNLNSCARYYYQVVSKEIATGIVSASPKKFFTTQGCDSDAQVLAHKSETVSPTKESSLSLKALKVTLPIGFYGQDVDFQISEIHAQDFKKSIALPRRFTSASNQAYLLSAFSDGKRVTKFSKPLLITFEYDPDILESIASSSLIVYRYNGIRWNPLVDCSTDFQVSETTCATTQLSTFGLFGKEKSATTPITSPSTLPAPTVIVTAEEIHAASTVSMPLSEKITIRYLSNLITEFWQKYLAKNVLLSAIILAGLIFAFFRRRLKKLYYQKLEKQRKEEPKI